jgi:hypothetical protein
MSRISFSTSVSLSSKSKDIEGTALATLSALMKAIKSNNARPVAFLLQERLQDRSERRQLNILLNAISTGLYRSKSQQSKKAVKPVQTKGTSTKTQSTKLDDATPEVKTVTKNGEESAAPRLSNDHRPGKVVPETVVGDLSITTGGVDKAPSDLRRDVFGRPDITPYIR